MGKVKIEKGVPIPPALRKAASPLRELEVGDSFLIGNANEITQRNYASKLGIKVSIRTDAEGNRRLWRTE